VYKLNKLIVLKGPEYSSAGGTLPIYIGSKAQI
jgi:hypothetical protein